MWIRKTCQIAAIGISLLTGPNHLFAERPNILFLCVDDLRSVRLGSGLTGVQTPHLDRLARRAMVFERAYCQQAVCNPSRASVMTGLRPDTLGIWDLRTHLREARPAAITLPQWLKSHGYFARGIGKIFHNWGQAIQGDPQSWSVPSEMHWGRHGDDWVRGDPNSDPVGKGKPSAFQSRDVPDVSYWDGQIADRACEAIRELPSDRPFFLAVGFWKPHLPFNAPQRDWQAWKLDDVELPFPLAPPERAPEIALHDFRELRGYRHMPKSGAISPRAMSELRHGYLAAVRFVDRQIGRVLDELWSSDFAENTVVVLWSDHGFHLGEHGLWCKTSCYEWDARVPLMISAPGYPHGGSHTQSLVELIDVFPTIVELCGLPVPPDLEGQSLVPILKNPRYRVKRAALTQHPRPAYFRNRPEVMGYSIRTESIRYTEWRRFGTAEVVARELYDHVNDPAESRNVIDSFSRVSEWQAAIAALESRVDSTTAARPTAKSQ